MIRSMTGYGEGERAVPQGTVRVSIKTVNHRFFNAHLRVPSGFDAIESQIQQWLKTFFIRGHINCTITLDREDLGGPAGLPELDLERAARYKEFLESMKEELGIEGEVDLAAMLRFGELFRAPEVRPESLEMDEAALKDLVDEAAGAAQEMREAEGNRLEEDLLERLEAMEEELARIGARAPLRLEAERDRLQAAIRELSQQDGVDEDRMARELAYVADRWDINEELVRFRAHIDAFRDTLGDATGEASGKRLGFLVQEMHREANTIASKANDVEIAHASVTVREEIERLREQLENVE
ncbi:YicC/YloC family endoribonuclease [Gemmatimonadota bacterium]